MLKVMFSTSRLERYSKFHPAALMHSMHEVVSLPLIAFDFPISGTPVSTLLFTFLLQKKEHFTFNFTRKVHRYACVGVIHNEHKKIVGRRCDKWQVLRVMWSSTVYPQHNSWIMKKYYYCFCLIFLQGILAAFKNNQGIQIYRKSNSRFQTKAKQYFENFCEQHPWFYFKGTFLRRYEIWKTRRHPLFFLWFYRESPNCFFTNRVGLNGGEWIGIGSGGDISRTNCSNINS